MASVHFEETCPRDDGLLSSTAGLTDLRLSLTVVSLKHEACLSAPISSVESFFEIFAKRRIPPFDRTVRQSVLDRIEVHVINMPVEIVLISDNVIPEAVLPCSARADLQSMSKRGSETHFDLMEERGNAGIQGIHNQMEMIGKHNPRSKAVG
jgi:hypothetical protein